MLPKQDIVIYSSKPQRLPLKIVVAFAAFVVLLSQFFAFLHDIWICRPFFCAIFAALFVVYFAVLRIVRKERRFMVQTLVQRSQQTLTTNSKYCCAFEIVHS